MNERIRKLAEQAAKWAQQAQWSTDPRFGDRPFSDLYDEKFAELMVRECAKVLTQHGSYFSGEGEPYHYAASLIEEHFGVEE
jgi:hypothetical protein